MIPLLILFLGSVSSHQIPTSPDRFRRSAIVWKTLPTADEVYIWRGPNFGDKIKEEKKEYLSTVHSRFVAEKQRNWVEYRFSKHTVKCDDNDIEFTLGCNGVIFTNLDSTLALTTDESDKTITMKPLHLSVANALSESEKTNSPQVVDWKEAKASIFHGGKTDYYDIYMSAVDNCVWTPSEKNNCTDVLPNNDVFLDKTFKELKQQTAIKLDDNMKYLHVTEIYQVQT